MQNPQLTMARFLLAVGNLERSTNYYVSTLGLQVEFIAPGISFMSRDNLRLMLRECFGVVPPDVLGDHSWYGYVTVSDATTQFDEYRTRGAEFTQWLADKSWGMREFGVRTVDGHRLMFGQELQHGRYP